MLLILQYLQYAVPGNIHIPRKIFGRVGIFSRTIQQIHSIKISLTSEMTRAFKEKIQTSGPLL